MRADLAPKGSWALMERRVRRGGGDTWGTADTKDLQDQLLTLMSKGPLGILDQRGYRGAQALKGIQETRDPMGLLGKMGPQEVLVHKALLVIQVLTGTLEVRVSLVALVSRARMAYLV